jgi:hypothetical protein
MRNSFTLDPGPQSVRLKADRHTVVRECKFDCVVTRLAAEVSGRIDPQFVKDLHGTAAALKYSREQIAGEQARAPEDPFDFGDHPLGLVEVARVAGSMKQRDQRASQLWESADARRVGSALF